MAQISIGKQLPNLKITLGNDYKSNDVLEEGEASEDENSLVEISDKIKADKSKPVEINRKFSSPLETFRKYENRGGGFITGLDLSLESISKKLEERASRFGVEEQRQRPITQAEITALYESLNIDSNENSSSSAKSKNMRLDALHMRGVEEMSTNDIFDYFKEYGPSTVEWINDYSCNVVWLDETGAARALLGLSRVLIIQKKSQIKDNESKENMEIEGKKDNKGPQIEEVIIMTDSESDEEDDDEEDKHISYKHQKSKEDDEEKMQIDDEENKQEVKMDETKNLTDQKSDIDVPVPPGHWRLGLPHTKAKAILLRFATKDDRKLPGAEKRSRYYKKYGNPNYGGMRGIISATRKRKINATRNKISIQHLENKDGSTNSKIDDFPIYMTNPGRVKHVRMRMYADDEELKILKKVEKRHRSPSNKPNSNVHNRLGRSGRHKDAKVRKIITREDDEEEDDDEEDEFKGNSSHNIRSFVLKPNVKSKVASRYNIWTSLAKTMAKESEEILPKRKKLPSSSKDLRNKLHTSFQRERTSSYDNDLRSKLNKLRRNSRLVALNSPLVVEIGNTV